MLYVGTYSLRDAAGIYEVEFDATTGRLALLGTFVRLSNPSFLAWSPDQRRLYSVCEERQDGAVAAVDVAGRRVINSQSTLGGNTCHVAVDPTGRCVVVANYGTGSVAAFPVAADGSLQPAGDLQQHAGSGPDTDRQQQPHAHSVNFDPSGRFVIAADLGIDRLMVYELDAPAAKLTRHDEVIVQPGAGPRHFTFHPNGRWAYLINELDNTVVAYSWEEGKLAALQTIVTLPDEFSGTSYCADIHVHRSGRFLYGTNRGHDSLAIFAVDAATGLLEARGQVPTYGEHPRNFTLTADGRWLLVANQDTDNIVVFRVSEDGGSLERVGDEFKLPAPVCLLFD